MMPAISKTATVSQTDEWRANRRVRLYHSCIDILSTKINDLVGRDVYIRFADNMTRRSRVFLDFLCMDGDEVSTATMCPTTQCTTCWCPRDLLDSTKDTFPFRDTVEVCSELQAERERLLDPDGTPRDRCKEKVYIKYIPTLFLSYDDFIPSIYRLYSCHMTTSFHLYTDSILVI